jgi:DNA helicase-2/ATP-dependent DNA helicase PcrA
MDFITEVALVADVDRWDTERNSVTLMTVHAAKGLEFPVVFVSGLEEGLFPLSSKEQDEMEEERRLFYVAITRAKKKVYLSYTKQRYRFGRISFQSPSRFLSEIESELLDQEHSGRTAVQRSLWETRPAFSSIFPTLDHVGQEPEAGAARQFETRKETEMPPIRVGCIVQHQFFGQGKVIDVYGKGDNERVVVLFSANQKKQLMVRYANLRIVRG